MEDNLTQRRSHITFFPHPKLLFPYLLKRKGKIPKIHKYDQKGLLFCTA